MRYQPLTRTDFEALRRILEAELLQSHHKPSCRCHLLPTLRLSPRRRGDSAAHFVLAAQQQLAGQQTVGLVKFGFTEELRVDFTATEELSEGRLQECNFSHSIFYFFLR